MDLDLRGHVALVTGSATGLGHACAEAFSRQGAHVALVSPNLDDLAYASDRLHAIGEGDIFGLEADVRNPAQVSAFVAEALEQYGSIDHLVTGPRPLEPAPFLEVSDEDWFRGFDRLFMSVVWTMREAYPRLRESDHGTIVTVTNPVLSVLEEQFAVANSFGRAVDGLTTTQAQAFAPDVRVNAVLPGPHETPDLERFLTDCVDAGLYADRDEAWTALMHDCPYDTPGDPLALGELVAFLSSEHAAFINGASIPVDGGARRSR